MKQLQEAVARLAWELRTERCYAELLEAERDEARAECKRLREQIEHLANVIMHEVPGEPSRSEGACDCAIRLIRDALADAPGPGATPLLLTAEQRERAREVLGGLENAGYRALRALLILLGEADNAEL